MENRSEHAPEQQPSPTTPTEASDSFLKLWFDKLPPKLRLLAFLPAAALAGTQAGMGNYKTAIAEGAIVAVALTGALLANRYLGREETNKDK